MAISIDAEIDVILEKDGRYSRNAYTFVVSALSLAMGNEPGNHLSGKQLLEAIKVCATRNYGSGAPAIFREWGVRSCRDFSAIVSNLVDQKLLVRSLDDDFADFDSGLDFETAFPEPFYKNRVFLATCAASAALIFWILISKS